MPPITFDPSEFEGVNLDGLTAQQLVAILAATGKVTQAHVDEVCAKLQELAAMGDRQKATRDFLLFAARTFLALGGIVLPPPPT